MTRSEETYAILLNMLGSDIPDQEFQDIVDNEHALLDPRFKEILEGRRKALEVAVV